MAFGNYSFRAIQLVVVEAFCNCCRYQFDVETCRNIRRFVLEVDEVDEVDEVARGFFLIRNPRVLSQEATGKCDLEMKAFFWMCVECEKIFETSSCFI